MTDKKNFTTFKNLNEASQDLTAVGLLLVLSAANIIGTGATTNVFITTY